MFDHFYASVTLPTTDYTNADAGITVSIGNDPDGHVELIVSQ